jgi:hypothetical protein
MQELENGFLITNLVKKYVTEDQKVFNEYLKPF